MKPGSSQYKRVNHAQMIIFKHSNPERHKMSALEKLLLKNGVIFKAKHRNLTKRQKYILSLQKK